MNIGKILKDLGIVWVIISLIIMMATPYISNLDISHHPLTFLIAFIFIVVPGLIAITLGEIILIKERIREKEFSNFYWNCIKCGERLKPGHIICDKCEYVNMPKKKEGESE